MAEFYYRAELQTIADRYLLDPDLVHAVCLQESSGMTSAYRFEPAFWMHYMNGKPEWDGAVPQRVSASYGLLQCMYPVALEQGYDRKDPPEHLFVPLVGLEFGCRKLREVHAWAHGDVAAALAAYNGGKTRDNGPGIERKRNQDYVDKVLRQLERVKHG